MWVLPAAQDKHMGKSMKKKPDVSDLREAVEIKQFPYVEYMQSLPSSIIVAEYCVVCLLHLILP